MDANTKKLNQVEAIEIVSRFCWLRLAGMCITMCWYVSRTCDIPAALSYDTMDFDKCDTTQLLGWLVSTHSWNVETQRWECVYGVIDSEQVVNKEKCAA